MEANHRLREEQSKPHKSLGMDRLSSGTPGSTHLHARVLREHRHCVIQARGHLLAQAVLLAVRRACAAASHTQTAMHTDAGIGGSRARQAMHECIAGH